MDSDGVEVALDLILEEVNRVYNELKLEGAAAFQAEDPSRVDTLNGSAKELHEFRQKVLTLRGEWVSKVDAGTRTRIGVTPAGQRTPAKNPVVNPGPVVVAPPPSYTIPPHSKGPATGLSVRLESGKVIHRGTAAQTFADVLNEFGLERVERLGITLNKLPLVGTVRSGKYAQVSMGRHFVMTHSNTEKKKELLEHIARRLGTRIVVSIL